MACQVRPRLSCSFLAASAKGLLDIMGHCARETNTHLPFLLAGKPVRACGSQAAWKVSEVTGVTPRSHPEGAVPFVAKHGTRRHLLPTPELSLVS